MDRKWIMVDVEADGPCPGEYSMIELGAVVVEPELENTFYTTLRPTSEKYMKEALKAIGRKRVDTLVFDDPASAMSNFNLWLSALNCKPMFISDNNGFDWQFVNYYFWYYLGHNPFGYSSTNLGSLYKGYINNFRKNFKHLRKTKHDHNPVNDAKGNAEALLHMVKQGLKMDL